MKTSKKGNKENQKRMGGKTQNYSIKKLMNKIEYVSPNKLELKIKMEKW